MDFSDLNEKQTEAVKCTEGPLLILAGAGSGKTTTMTRRIAYMIERGVKPYNILAVTFTNKAAGEMRDRVRALTGDIFGMWIMTFHSMCLRILRKDAEIIGYDNNFVIYDTQDQKVVLKNIVKDLNLDSKEYRVPYLMTVISSQKEKGLTPDEMEEYSDGGYKAKALVRVYREYEKRLKENNAMDFDDLLNNCYKLLRSSKPLLESYRERFRYIMVDEYQDTNHIQYKLIKVLAEKHQNICVVGDDDQCIYQWRGADIRNILDFEQDFPDAKVIKLEQNYRSMGNILAAAHSVIANNKSRKAKKLWTDKAPGDKITYMRADTEKEEASFIAGEIELLHGGKGMNYSDFAILYRTNVQSRQFEEAFTRRQIPYRVLSGLRYYDRKEIKDIMAYMRLVVNPKDDLSLRRIINEPKRGMGDKTVDKLAALAYVRGESLLETLADPEVIASLSGKARTEVKNLVDVLAELREEKEALKVSDIYDILLMKTGYLPALEKENTVEAEGRVENLLEFKTVIYDYEKEAQSEEQSEDGPPTIEGLMEKLALMADIDNHDESQDAVVLMTMHSAKGLEFPVVFIPGMEDGLFPGHRSFDSQEEMEEERRLCYVGMTRAKDRLFLTGAANRTLYGRTEFTRESQFLREVDPKLLTGDSVYVRTMRFDYDSTDGPGVDTGSYDGYASRDLAGVRPFDSLRYAKEAIRESINKTEGIQVGDTVSHPKFGEGLVTEEEANALVVEFYAAGRKKLAKGIAPLKKI